MHHLYPQSEIYAVSAASAVASCSAGTSGR
jgi:hypothetical protein